MEDELESSLRDILTHIVCRENKTNPEHGIPAAKLLMFETDIKILMLVVRRAKEMGYADSLTDAHNQPPQQEPWVLDSEDE